MKKARNTKEGRALIRQAEECAKHFTASAAAPRRKTELAAALMLLCVAAMAVACWLIYSFVF